MLFNSYEFLLLFLPITFFVYFYLNSKKQIVISKIFLVLASLFLLLVESYLSSFNFSKYDFQLFCGTKTK